MDPNGICYAMSNQASDIVVYNGIVQYSKISQADIPEWCQMCPQQAIAMFSEILAMFTFQLLNI